MSRWLSGLAVVLSSSPGVHASAVGPQSPGQGGIVTTKATITSEGRWERKIFTVQGAVEVTTTETCRFEILDWSKNGVTLERQSCETVVTAEGRGATAYPPPRLSEPWFC